MANHQKQAIVFDPLAGAILASPQPEAKEVPATEPEPKKQAELPRPPPKDPAPPAPEVKAYVVLEHVPRISIGGQLSSLAKGHIVSELGYDIDKLRLAGVKLEPVK